MSISSILLKLSELCICNLYKKDIHYTSVFLSNNAAKIMLIILYQTFCDITEKSLTFLRFVCSNFLPFPSLGPAPHPLVLCLFVGLFAMSLRSVISLD